MMDKQMEDAEIISRVLSGEKQLYELIVRRFNPVLYRIGRTYGYNHEDTQDIMQESFVDAYRGLSGFRGDASFKTWISRVMLNRCFQQVQKTRLQKELTVSINDNKEAMYTSSENETEKRMKQRELAFVLGDSMSKIPLDYRMVFILREVNGMDTAQTAALLNITPSNVKVRLNRSKTMLRKEIEKSFDVASIFEFNLRYCDGIVNEVMKKI